MEGCLLLPLTGIAVLRNLGACFRTHPSARDKNYQRHAEPHPDGPLNHPHHSAMYYLKFPTYWCRTCPVCAFIGTCGANLKGFDSSARITDGRTSSLRSTIAA